MDFKDGCGYFDVRCWMPDEHKQTGMFMLTFSRSGGHFYSTLHKTDLQKLIDEMQAVVNKEQK